MKTFRIFTPILVMALILAGCSQPTPAALPTPTSTYSPLILLPTQEATVQLPTVTAQPQTSATASAFNPIEAKVVFDNYRLRQGPGLMFEAVKLYEIDTKVTLLARERGDNWVLVQTEDYRSGWMKIDGLEYIGDISPLPILAVTGAQVIRGRVLRTDMTPATKIGVSIKRVDNASPDFEDYCMTNDAGEWYLYLPLEMSGNWTIGTNAYSPESNAVDASGNIVGGWPGAQLITLPLQADVSFEFAFTK
jgi:hypothetical protein